MKMRMAKIGVARDGDHRRRAGLAADAAAPVNSLVDRSDPNTHARTYVLSLENMGCVSGERLAAAIASRRAELWDSNPRLAERIEMRIKEGQRAHRQAHGSGEQAARCLADLQFKSAEWGPEEDT